MMVHSVSERQRRTGADVVPVRIIRGLLFEMTGFNKIDPSGNVELPGALQVRGVGFNERIGATRI